MKKVMTGKVVSEKMTKTVTVEVERVFVHPLYEKRLKRRKKFLAHNEVGAKIGDIIEVEQTRPMSARKRWRVTKILKDATT